MEMKTFDIAANLESREDIRAFLEEVVATGTEADFIHALGTAAKAKGMTRIANQVGVTRASLYKSLAEDGNPSFATINKVVKALGCQLSVVA